MAEKEKAKRNFPGADYPCNVCGETHYSWGKVAKSGELFPGTLLYYQRIDKTELWDQTYVREAMARTCEVCGNVQLFVMPRRQAAEQSPDDPLKGLFED